MTDIVYERTGTINTDFDYPGYGPSIDDDNILEDILNVFGYGFEGHKTEDTWGNQKGAVRDLVVTIGVHVQNGKFEYTQGDPGYSEMTDWVLDCMMVGNVDLLNVLEEYHGRMVTIRVDTGPSYKIG